MDTEELHVLIERLRVRTMTREEREAQRINFAYGNGVLSNDAITQENIARLAGTQEAE